jgi:hypothetical protein
VKLDKSGKLLVTEADIERTCTEWLALDGWRCLKTDPVSRPEWGKGFGEKGMADCLYIRYYDHWDSTRPASAGNPNGVSPQRGYPASCAPVELIWIEWKSKTGRAAAHQLEWQAREVCRGAMVLCAGRTFPQSIEGFQEWYRASGMQRRGRSIER